MVLLVHDLRIVHRPGAQNHVPDALSGAFENLVYTAFKLISEDVWYISQFRKVQSSGDRFPHWKILDHKLFVHETDSWIAPLLVIPQEFRLKVLKECRDSPSSRHLNNQQTPSLLLRHYFWSAMRVDCARFVRECLECQKVRHSNLKPQGLMRVKSYQDAWSVEVANIQGPFPSTLNQFKYLSVAGFCKSLFLIIQITR